MRLKGLSLGPMIRLFNEIWLCHDYQGDDQSNLPREFQDRELAKVLLDPQNSRPFWESLLFDRRLRYVMTSNREEFVSLFTLFFSAVLKDKSPENLQSLLDLYFLDAKFKNLPMTAEFCQPLEIQKNLDRFAKTPNPIPASLSLDQMGFEWMLANHLIDGRCQKALIHYVKWSCWTTLFSELRLFASEIRRDLYNAHEVTESNLGFAKLKAPQILSAIEKDSNWNFVLDHRIFEIPHIDQLENSIAQFKKYFPTANHLMKIINNHALAHYDSQGVDSYREPVEMIYAERYEELLHRDLAMPFRMTYASEHLGDHAVCTYLSRIYHGYKHKQPELYRIFDSSLNSPFT